MPALKEWVPVQRTEKLSFARPLPGPPEPQLSLMLDWQAVNVGLPLRLMLLKYSARNCPGGHAVEVMEKLKELEMPLPRLKTDTRAVPAVAISLAGIAAVSGGASGAVPTHFRARNKVATANRKCERHATGVRTGGRQRTQRRTRRR